MNIAPRRRWVKYGLLALGLVVAAVAVTLLVRSISPTLPPTVSTSEKGGIKLDQIVKDTSLTNSSQLSGAVTSGRGDALFYVVRNKDSIAVASGAIEVGKDGRFSRNISFSTTPSKGEALTLKLYTQQPDGKPSDNLDVDVRFE